MTDHVGYELHAVKGRGWATVARFLPQDGSDRDGKVGPSAPDGTPRGHSA